jgi:hypothetical protein
MVGQAQTGAGGGQVANHTGDRAAAAPNRRKCRYGVPQNDPSFVHRAAVRCSRFDHAEDSRAFRTIVRPDIVVRGTGDDPIEDHGRATCSTDRICGLLHIQKLNEAARISYPRNYGMPGSAFLRLTAMAIRDGFEGARRTGCPAFAGHDDWT